MARTIFVSLTIGALAFVGLLWYEQSEMKRVMRLYDSIYNRQRREDSDE